MVSSGWEFNIANEFPGEITRMVPASFQVRF